MSWAFYIWFSCSRLTIVIENAHHLNLTQPDFCFLSVTKWLSWGIELGHKNELIS